MPINMSSRVSLSAVSEELKSLTKEERAALRASRFHCAPAPPPPDRQCRLAHPGGALATNKAAALAKFLKRKLEKDGAATLDPALVECAVKRAKATVRSGTSDSAVARVRHVASFSDSDEDQLAECDKKLKRGGGTSVACKKSKKEKQQNFLNVGEKKSKKEKKKSKKEKKKKPS